MAPDADAGKSVKRADPFAPLTSEQLVVGDGHDIYVESVGRVGGTPAVYLHGGPGSGCQPDHRRLFDPERFHAVLFDQRGKRPVTLGLQLERFEGAHVFVLPNPSGRNANYSYEEMLLAFRMLRRGGRICTIGLL